MILGPMSYLFHKTHEQSYVAHVIGYSMCMGPYANESECRYYKTNSATKNEFSVYIMVYFLLIFNFLY